MERRKSAPAWACASIVLVVLAFMVGGCGSSSNGGSTTADSTEASKTKAPTAATTLTPPTTSSPPTSTQTPGASGKALSQPDLIGSADTICRRVTAELAAAKPKSVSVQEIERVVPRNVAIEQKGLGDLAKLRPPASVARDWRLALGYVRTLASELGTLVNDAKSNNAAGVKALAVSKARVREALLAVAKRIGLKDCGQV